MSITFNAENFGAEFLGVAPLGSDNAVGKRLQDAIKAWRNLLGSEHVLFDWDIRQDYSKTTLPQGTRPAGIVRPSTASEVQSVVCIARRFNVPLHAISRGKNWGYGDACAPADGYVVVELTRMNRIREVNVELGYAIIEPGVSQGQMYAYLQENRIPLLLDVTGAGPDASIVGNILQRGFGHTIYGDRFRHTSGFEVVLSDGRLIKTGFGKHENAKAAEVFPWGDGPWIDGLFTQSQYGIVTCACIWLMPTPAVVEGFALKIHEESLLPSLIDALRGLRMAGTIRSTVHVANDLRLLAASTAKRDEGCLASSERSRLRQSLGIGAWNLLGANYGTELEVRGMRRVIRDALKPIANVRFFRRSTLNRTRAVLGLIPRARWTRPLRQLLNTTQSAFDLLEGIPSSAHLNGVYWASRIQTEAQHDIRDAGLIWVSPVAPLLGRSVVDVLQILNRICAEYGFDAPVTISTVNERAACCVTSIHFDKRCEDEAARAASCEQHLEMALNESGYYCYRHSSFTAAQKASRPLP